MYSLMALLDKEPAVIAGAPSGFDTGRGGFHVCGCFRAEASFADGRAYGAGLKGIKALCFDSSCS